MTPADASRTARQLTSLLASANREGGDLHDVDALNRAADLVELAGELAARLQPHLDSLALQAQRSIDNDGAA